MIAAGELYAAAPSDFTGRRTALVRAARQDGDRAAAREIGALRKPTVAAWAVNHLVRRDPPTIQALSRLAGELRSAQTRLDAAALKDLRAERDRVLNEVVRAAARHAEQAGERLSPATLTEVRDSAVAALASPAATAAFTSGTLTRALRYSGFGDVDVADAVARTGTGVALAVIRGGRSAEPAGAPSGVSPAEDAELQARAEDAERQARAEGARRHAELALARSRRALAAADAAVDDARAASDAARRRVESARIELAEAEAEDRARLDAVSDAVQARRAAQAQVSEAERAVAELG